MKTKRAGKHGTLAFKADLSKAYDRVEWPFVEKMLLTLGYNERWVSLLMDCISTVNYSVCFNGSPGESFRPTRGLRQGCPLSPYLFLVCAEGLSQMLNQAMVSRTIRGASIGRGRLEIGHLFFADDSICFAQATEEAALALKHILTRFGSISGQRVNYEKSLLFFSLNVPTSITSAIGLILGVRVATNPERYLGLPTMVGRNKTEAFSYYMDRVTSKSSSYSTKFLSMGGKATLIRSVLQSIPVYAMNCFLLPSSLCHGLEQAMAKFWWKNAGTGKGIHWTTWNNLAQSKHDGGMGFRNLSQFNVALLAKQCWRILKHPNSLLARVLKARYHPSTDFLHARLCSNPSYTWRSLWSSRGLLEKGLTWNIGNGESINIWNDPWIPNTADGRPHVDDIDINHTKVADLIDTPAKCWKQDVLHNLFPSPMVSTILEIPLPDISQPDTIVWRHDKGGAYTVKSGYKLLRSTSTVSTSTSHLNLRNFYTHLWCLQLPEKLKITMWKFVNNFIPTFDNLRSRCLNVQNGCQFCQSAYEGVDHLFQECWYSQAIFEAQGLTPSLLSHNLLWQDWITQFFESLNDDARKIFVVSCWAIWYARNKAVHDDLKTIVQESIAFIQAYILEQETFQTAVQPQPRNKSQQWSPPQGNLIKVNFDAAYCTHSKISTSGVICRNNAGLIMGACSMQHTHVCNAFLAEALSCRDAVTFALDMRFDRVIFEGDSLSVIKKLRSKDEDLSQLRVLINDIKQATFNLRDATFTHVRREGNLAAHAMAHYGRQHTTPTFWVEDAPTAVLAVVETDKQRFHNSS
ncbi:hypothetical protein HRI_005091400 [Hibiscus trionum]|uniref:Reverse transcriptase domain-containing protein n=1 Tax=Hibiscus trionum TaxID=183268 RepID=A0A9W7JJC1_HIBTR|nr:hypothetical protein HRI_005091400 [Hibiscus trionum]